MSIKINLMPPYVALQRRFRVLAGISTAALLGTAAILAVVYLRNAQQAATLQTQLEEATTVAGYTDKAKKAQAVAETAAAPKEAFVTFIVAAGQTGSQRAALLDLVQRYISPDAVISQIDMSDGQHANITATLRSPDDYARFLLNLRAGSATRGGQLFAAEPTTAVVPQNALPGTGFTRPFRLPDRTFAPQNATYPITMNVVGTLKDPVSVPADPGAPPATTTATTTVPVGTAESRPPRGVRSPAPRG